MKNNKKSNGGKKNNKGENKDIISRGVNKINDMIAPDSIVNEQTFYAVGNNLVRTLMVTGYPRTVYMGWLDDLYSYDANIDISLHITPWPTNKVIKTLSRRISQFMSTINMDDKKGQVTDVEITTALEDAEELRDKLHTGTSKFFYQAMYISLSAKYLEDLDQLTDDIESICGSAQMTTRNLVKRQNKGFLSVLPIGDDQIKKTRNFDTESASTFFPLVSAELTDVRGDPILYGINQINNSLVMFDRFKLNNYNSVTLATSGSGKSYTVKLEAIRYYLMGTKIIIIDPENEYKEIAETLGGQFINLSSSSEDRINPLDIYEGTESEDDERSFLTSKIMDVFSLLQVMLGPDRSNKLTTTEKKSILSAAQNMYEKFNIRPEGFVADDDDLTVDEEFITIGSEKQEMPSLSDLDSSLKEIGEDGTRIAEELDPYINGVMDLFNGETNVELNNDFIVFGLKDLEEGMSELAMFICLEYIWNRIKSGDKQKRLLMVDEAWKLMKNVSSAGFLEKVAKTARKFNAGLSIITQNVKDFVQNGGENIVNNTSIQILLKQKPNELDDLEAIVGISENEKVLLRTLDTGEALIYAGQNKTLVDIVSNDFEHKLCETNSEG